LPFLQNPKSSYGIAFWAVLSDTPKVFLSSNQLLCGKNQIDMSLSTTIKSIQDIMRKDDGVDGDAQRIGQNRSVG
jgi:hypothetical protein